MLYKVCLNVRFNIYENNKMHKAEEIKCSLNEHDFVQMIQFTYLVGY